MKARTHRNGKTPLARCLRDGLLVVVCVPLCVASQAAGQSDLKPEFARDKEAMLKSAGFPYETTDDLIAVLASDDAVARKVALRLLAIRKGAGAVPFLQKGLSDESLIVREESAHVLGELGDRSGLAQMQKDFDALIAPALQKDGEALAKLSKYSFLHPLHIGQVLAELGDPRAFHLAEATLRRQDIRTLHGTGIRVLGKIASLDPRELAAAKIDPIRVLQEAVKTSERSGDTVILLEVLYATGRDGFPPQAGNVLLDQLLDTHRLPDWARGSAARRKGENAQKLAASQPAQ